MRRLPPQNIEENLAGLIDLVAILREAILTCRSHHFARICFLPLTSRSRLQKTKTPSVTTFCVITIATATPIGLAFLFALMTHHIRSPWSNTYFPHIDDGNFPSPKLRELEIQV